VVEAEAVALTAVVIKVLAAMAVDKMVFLLAQGRLEL